MTADPDPVIRAHMAGRADAAPELLFYLADDDDPLVRRAVAANDRTPVRAAPRLARDRDGDVRALLGGKLARALPHLTAAEHEAMRDLAANALSLLAADQLVRVRAAVASAIKDVDCAPPRLVATLARDLAREVAEPVLRTCALLSDDDLLAIIAAHPEPWVLDAISRRPNVSPPVADAIMAEEQVGDEGGTEDGAADGARAAAESQLPAPLPDLTVIAEPATRPKLPDPVADKLADFVEEGVREALIQGGDFDVETGGKIADVTRRRLDFARGYSGGETPESRALTLYKAFELTEETLWDAVAWGDRAFVRASIALLAQVPAAVVQRILDLKTAKGITALAWRAGLSMRGARLLQNRLAGIHPRQVLNARHGTDYPLTEAEMNFELELFGINPAPPLPGRAGEEG